MSGPVVLANDFVLGDMQPSDEIVVQTWGERLAYGEVPRLRSNEIQGAMIDLDATPKHWLWDDPTLKGLFWILILGGGSLGIGGIIGTLKGQRTAITTLRDRLTAVEREREEARAELKRARADGELDLAGRLRSQREELEKAHSARVKELQAEAEKRISKGKVDMVRVHMDAKLRPPGVPDAPFRLVMNVTLVGSGWTGTSLSVTAFRGRLVLGAWEKVVNEQSPKIWEGPETDLGFTCEYEVPASTVAAWKRAHREIHTPPLLRIEEMRVVTPEKTISGWPVGYPVLITGWEDWPAFLDGK
jgi:hypothetical protein